VEKRLAMAGGYGANRDGPQCGFVCGLKFD